MANITINDLHATYALDRTAMSRIRGASGAPWVFGWISPFVAAAPSQVPVINFYQINNYADQMINQYQMVSVVNSAPDSKLDVNVGAGSVNNRL